MTLMIMIANKYRSNFEKGFARNLEKRGIEFEYEPTSFNYFLKVRSGQCKKCGNKEVAQEHRYTPDFKIGNIYLELKGNFIIANRLKMLAVREEHPEIDLRIIFMFDNKLDKKNTRRYSDWCKKYNFKYAFMELPREWEEEIV